MFKIILLISVLSASLLLSCKKFVDTAGPQNELLDQAVFFDSVNATSVINGIYVKMLENRKTITSAGLTIFTGLSSDELITSTGIPDEDEFYANNISPTNNINSSEFWSYAYNIIYSANACIEGVNKSQTLPASVKSDLTGEAKFIRAYMYFNLVNLYGDVPLVLSTEYEINKTKPRSAVIEIYQQITEDLIDARSKVKKEYITSNRERPNYYAIMALLSKTYLYTKKWPEAENAANEIINSGFYNLESNLTDVFTIASNEVIWRMPPVVTIVPTWEGFYFISSDLPDYMLTNNIIASFETNDSRLTSWTGMNIVDINGTLTQCFYPYKYKQRVSGSPNENIVMFRLGEIYLIRAESSLMQNKLNEGRSDLDAIRQRAGLSSLNISLNQDGLLAAMEHERRIELFAEKGNRWFDLKRLVRANAVLGSVKISWQPTDALYPIPKVEINSNPSLIQNPGY